MERPAFSFSEYQLNLFLDYLQIFTIKDPEEVPPEELFRFPSLPKYRVERVPEAVLGGKIRIVFERPVEINGDINTRFRFSPNGGFVIRLNDIAFNN